MMAPDKRVSVLVVDDEVDFLETIVKRLEKRHIHARGVVSGEAALAALREGPFDVVLLDIKMPGGMDGIVTLREMKRLQPMAEVILLTGHASVETSIEGMKLGAFDYLLKPIRFEEVLAKIQAAGVRKNEQGRKIPAAGRPSGSTVSGNGA
ncbi:MAG: response regulator [Pseudomonadota bacterium]